MPSYKRPGVYFEETVAQAAVVSGANLSAAAFVAANPRGPTTAKLVTSWSQYLSWYGGFGTATEYLPHAVYNFFNNGGREAYVVRVAGSGAVTATRTANDRAGTPLATLRIDATSPGLWGNTIYYDITDLGTDRFNLIVKYGGTTDAHIVERWADLSMVDSDARYAPTVINSTSAGSAYIVVTDLNSATAAPNDRPAVQANQALATGTNGSTFDVATALTQLDQVDRPLNLNLPGNSTDVGAALTYASGRGDVFVVIDPPSGNTSAQAITYATGLGSNSYGAVYYPWVQMADPASSAPGAMRMLPPGGAVIGQYASTDVLRGVYKTPAGLNSRIAGAVGVERFLTNTDLDNLNAANVNAIRQLPGAGIVILGGRTLKLSGSDKYVAVRRTLIYLRSSLVTSTRFALFEPNDERLWLLLRTMIERFLRTFWQGGGLRGTTPEEAFYIKCDDENNSPSTIANGEVRIEIGVALQFPAEFVVIKLSQREVGATVTVQA